MSARTRVDVLLLAYCKTPREYQMTMECLRSLHASESSIDFDVVLVETATREELRCVSNGALYQGLCRAIFPEQPFHYNKFLRRAYASLRVPHADYLLMINNDLRFRPGFASALMRGLAEFESVSPWSPGYHEQLFDGQHVFYEGYRTTRELCGWALMLRRSILEQVPFAALFPDDFAFWFQDNFYGYQLERHRMRHALVRDALVEHLFEQSHRLIPDANRHAFTTGSEQAFHEACRRSGPVEPSSRQTTPDASGPVAPLNRVIGFWHIEAADDWQDIVTLQLEKLRSSGLYQRSERIYVGITGDPGDIFSPSEHKIELLTATSSDVAPLWVLNQLHRACASHDGAVFYIHTLGAAWPSAAARDWRDLLDHFVIDRHADCLQALATYDVCGVNWANDPLPHFAGNYWWARAEYIRRLPPVDDYVVCQRLEFPDEDLLAASWSGSLPDAKCLCLHHSGVNHYHQRYPRERYALSDYSIQ